MKNKITLIFYNDTNICHFVFLIGTSLFLCSKLVNSIKLLLISLFIIYFIYLLICKKANIKLYKNTGAIISIFIAYSLLSYYLITEYTNYQSYITYNIKTKIEIIKYGITLLIMMLIGCYIGIIIFYNEKKYTTQKSSKYNYKIIKYIAWIPILIAALLYITILSGHDYVFAHTIGTSNYGKMLKTIYITYSCILILAINDHEKDQSYLSIIHIWIGIVIVFGLLINVRSQVFITSFLIIYFYYEKIGLKKIFLFLILLFFLFIIIGNIRDISARNTYFTDRIIVSLFSIGEFPEILRYSLESLNAPFFSSGIHMVGTFLGFIEPLANRYAQSISQEYFFEGGGFGSYILAEFVIAFGQYGSFLGIFLFGMFISRLNYKFKNFSLNSINPMMFAFCFPLIRNDFGITLRGVLYAVIGVALISQKMKLKNKI